MASIIRTRVLSRVFGEGVGGVVSVALASWAIDKVREGIGSDPELLDVSQLKAGETYTIVTRPAPTRAERKLESQRSALDRASRKASRQSGSQRRSERRANTAVKRSNKLTSKHPDSSKTLKAQQIAAKKVDRSNKLSAPSKKSIAADAKLLQVTIELDQMQAASLQRAARSRRRVRREFR